MIDDLYLTANPDNGELQAELTLNSDQAADAVLSMEVRRAPGVGKWRHN